VFFQKLSFVQVWFESSKSGFGFSNKFWFVQVRSFSGGEFPNFIGLKIVSCFLVQKVAFQICSGFQNRIQGFRQSFCKQVVSFCKVCFFWLTFFLAKSGFQNRLHFFSAKVLASLVHAFCQAHFLWQSNFFAKSVFRKGFGKFSALAFFQVSRNFQNKIRLVKNCGAGKIKSVKAGFWFLGGESSKCRAH